MPSKTLKLFDARNCEQWRKWLAQHHHSASEVWLVFYKGGRPSIEYGAAVDEALCFGWIDSQIRRLDDHRYARKFTPRKLDSKWSTSNRKRYAQLEASGRLAPAGLKRPPTGRSGDAPKPSPSKIPPYIQRALEDRPKARDFFDSLAPSYRRLYIAWIDSAKRQETKIKRLREAVELLAAGTKLGMK